MNTPESNLAISSEGMDKWILSGLNRFIFLFDPLNYVILYRGGALNERVVPGDGTLLPILSASSADRLKILTHAIRGVYFSYGLEFRLSSGQIVASYGSLKRVFFQKKEMILGVFYFGSDTGAKARFQPGFSLDITHHGYWVGNMDKTFFANKNLEKMFGSDEVKWHLFDFCVKGDRPALEMSLHRVLSQDVKQAECVEVGFRGPGKDGHTFQLRMVRGEFGGEPVVRVVFLEMDSWVFQLEISMYHRRLEMAASCFIGDFMRGTALEAVLNRILADAGQLINASRGFIHQYYPDLAQVSMTHEWSADQVERVRSKSRYCLSDVKPFIDLMRQRKPVVVHAKQEAAQVFNWDAEAHIARAFLLFPLFLAGKFFGFIGFGEVRFERFWTLQEQEFVGKLAETVELLMDRAHLLSSLKREKIRAEEAGEVKERFLATVSHEVRNPLNAIIGLSGMLLEQGMGGENPIHKQALEFIRTSGQNLSRTMENVLYLSKLKLYDQNPDFQPVNLCELMNDLEIYLRGRMYGVKTVAGRVHRGDLPQSLVTDREFVFAILMNLLDNAVKFTEKGTVSLTAEVDKGDVIFYVTDTGIGIAPQYLKKIFMDFYQVEKVDTRKHGGIGAGLAIVKKMTDAIGGKIRVESEPGKGSRFIVSFPLRREIP